MFSMFKYSVALKTVRDDCFAQLFSNNDIDSTRHWGDFSQEFSFPARVISESLAVEKQRGNESTEGAHAIFEPGTLISLQII